MACYCSIQCFFSMGNIMQNIFSIIMHILCGHILVSDFNIANLWMDAFSQ